MKKKIGNEEKNWDDSRSNISYFNICIRNTVFSGFEKNG